LLAVARDAVARVRAYEVATGTARHPVGSASADANHVVAGAGRHDVRASAADDPVAPAAADQGVRAGASAKAVAPRVTGEQIAPAQADQHVVAAPAAQAVVAGGALKPIVAGASGALHGERDAGRKADGKRDQECDEEVAHDRHDYATAGGPHRSLMECEKPHTA
jgi:hypothetical protein